MTMTANVPESNVAEVASRIVHCALGDGVDAHGKGIAVLLAEMHKLANEIAEWYATSDFDWQAMLKLLEEGDSSAVKDTLGRDALAIGDVWAKEWLLCHLARYLHEELQRSCASHVAAESMGSITYDEDGSVASWERRSYAS